MRRRMFNDYQEGGGVNLFEEKETPDVQPTEKKPSIMGAPMPDTGMKKKGMGDIFSPKESITPKNYAQENAAKKRMSQFSKARLPNQLTGRNVQGMPGQQQPGAEQVSMGNRWLGEIWQDATANELNPMQQYAGYQSGGSVDSAMEIYNQTMSELDSGLGFSAGGPVYSNELMENSQELARHGRNGDTMMMHVNPAELEGLEQLFGPLTVNPDTGNPEAFGILAGLALGALGGGLMGGAAGDWKAKNILLGAGIGATLGGVGGAAAAPAVASGAPIAGSTGAATLGTTASTTAIPTGGALAGTPGLVWGPASGGVANVAVGGAGTAAPGAVSAGSGVAGGGLSKSGYASLMSSGLGSMQDNQQQQPPPPQMSMASSGPSAPAPPPVLPGRQEARRSRRKPRGRGRIGNVLGGIA